MKISLYFSLIAIAMLIVTCSGSSGESYSNSKGDDSIPILPQDVQKDEELMDSVATLVFAGDAMQHSSQLADARTKDGHYDYSAYFQAVESYIKNADYAVVNLETTLGANDFSGYPLFCSPDAYARQLKDSGFDMLLTANNHCLDRRDKGLRRTIEVLNSLGVDHIGTYLDKAQRDSIMPKIVEVNSFKIAMLNYTYGTNGIKVNGNVVVDYINKELIKSDIAEARDKGAELVCVNIHWGDEYKLLPNQSQKNLADFLVDEGADLIIGGHPHVIQPIEVRHSNKYNKDILLAYSLGNFISGMKKTDTSGGIMVKVKIKRDEEGKAIFDKAEYLPVFVEREGNAGKNFHLVVADSTARASSFLKNAYDIFNKYNVSVPRSKEL